MPSPANNRSSGTFSLRKNVVYESKNEPLFQLWERATAFYEKEGRWPKKDEAPELHNFIQRLYKHGTGKIDSPNGVCYPPTVLSQARKMGLFRNGSPYARKKAKA